MKNDNSNKQSNASKPMLANRLFKFRAWVKEQNRMIKVFGFNEHLVFEQTWDSPSIKENIFEIEDCHIMQFTGLLDKNGNKIFEGDIVTYKRSVGNWTGQTMITTHKIIFMEEVNAFVMDYGSSYIKLRKHWGYEYEVIGNIFENPDLLQGVI